MFTNTNKAGNGQGSVTRWCLPHDGSLPALQIAGAALLMVLQRALLLVAATTVAAFESFPHRLRRDFRSEGEKNIKKSNSFLFKPEIRSDEKCSAEWKMEDDGHRLAGVCGRGFFFTGNLAIY